MRIYGLPNTDSNFGIRDNGEGQMWSETKKVGSINYWTGDVVLAKEYIPKARGFRDELRSLLGLKSAEPNVSYEYEYEFKVSLLGPPARKGIEHDGLELDRGLEFDRAPSQRDNRIKPASRGQRKLCDERCHTDCIVRRD